MARSADLVIRGGVLYDGRGGAPVEGDLAIAGDSIAAVGQLDGWRGRDELDASGLAVAPGFVNMLSWAHESLLEDGRAQSDIRQGVTLEVMGEGFSMGPLTEPMKAELEEQSLLGHPVEWTTLGEYLEHLQRRGVAPNVAQRSRQARRSRGRAARTAQVAQERAGSSEAGTCSCRPSSRASSARNTSAARRRSGPTCAR